MTPRIALDPVRRSLWLALGLLAGCPKDPPADPTEATTTGGSSSDTGGEPGPTTGVVTTGEPGTTGTTGTTGETGESSGASETTGAVDSGDSTSQDASSEGATGDASTTSTETGGESGESSTATTESEPECAPLMQGFTDPPVPSGWEVCGDGLPHRTEAVACEVPATPSNCSPDAMWKDCESNADCVDGPFGSCQQGNGACTCTYGCATDADCAAGYVCRCAGEELGKYTACVPSKCGDDGDCGDEVCQFATSIGIDCGLYVTDGACTTPVDECEGDAMCGGGLCASENADFWYCSGQVCGRPWVIDTQAVTAMMVERDDWQGGCLAVLAPVELHAALAEHWTEIGLAEHASVASFAGFILQLLAVGAPAELVSAAQQALADEVEHARVGFALASMYAGRAVGPGPLVCGAAIAGDIDAVIAAVIREACVGETLSALEVREAAMRAEDPGLARTLQRVADDEQRHAELGWRFVRWALRAADDERRARARAVFAEALAGAGAAAERFAKISGTPALRVHGVVDAPLRAAVWRAGLATLVEPTAQRLCA